MTIYEKIINKLTEEEIKSFTTIKNDGKISIHSEEIFRKCHEYIEINDNITDIIDDFKRIADKSAGLHGRNVTTGAKNNCSGRWFELIFLKTICKKISDCNLNYNIYKLPSEDKGSFPNIFVNSIKNEIMRYNPRFSNPDFIIVRENYKISSHCKNILEKYNYKGFFSKYTPDDIIKVLSVKTSTRPDRRYQIMYEANMIHELFNLLNKSIEFIAISKDDHPADLEIYSSCSLRSIVTRNTRYKKIVKPILVRNIADIYHSNDFFPFLHIKTS